MNKEEILDKIKKASEAYYNTDTQIISDEEYDELVEYAETQGWLKQDSKLNDGAVIHKVEVEHKIPMLSLQKAKSELEISKFFDYIRKYSNSDFVVSPKLDGLALSIEYNNGNIVRLSTRGNGKFGEDVTHLVNSNEIEILNLPKAVDTSVTEIRGELACSKEDFLYNNTNRGENFKNERIASAGILSKSKKGLGYNARLTFIAYSAFSGEKQITIPNNIVKASDLFDFNSSKTLEELMDIIHKAEVWRKEISIPTDGVVINPTEILDLESTDHHPKNAIAYKYPGAHAQTVVKEVRFGIGKTGKLTPVAIVEPVELDGITVSNVTLNNLDWLSKRNIKIGSLVSITRANDVIPAIKSVIFNDENTVEIKAPDSCPICSSEIIFEDIYIKCSNYYCPAVIKSRILSYVGRPILDVEGLNEAVVDIIMPKNIVELISINKETLINLKYSNDISLGEKRALQIYNNLQKAKENTTEDIWFTTLEIPNIGKNTAKVLLNELGSIENVLNADLETLTKISTVGSKTAEDIISNSQNALSLWTELKDLIKLPQKITSNGESFAITGKVPEGFNNRDEYVKHLESKGYTYHSSVKAGTTYLITDKPEGNSSKLKKARSLNVKIISYL